MRKLFHRSNWREWLLVALALATLESAVLSIEQARWVQPQPSLTAVIILAVLTGYLFARSRSSAIVAYSLTLVFGVAVSLWQTLLLMPASGLIPRLNQLTSALYSGWQAITGAGPVESTIHLSLLLIIFIWVSGFTSVWFLCRRQNAWVTASLGGIIILINLSNLTPRYHIFLFFYLLASALLLGQQNREKAMARSYPPGTAFSRWGITSLLVSVLLAVLASSVAGRLPPLRSTPLETWVEARIAGIGNIEDYFSQQLSGVPRQQSVLRSEQQEFLAIGSPVSQGEQILFIITSKQPFYWWTHTYDTYTGAGWRSNPAGEKVTSETGSTAEYYKRTQVDYTVVTQLKTDLLLVAGEFIAADKSVSVQSLSPASYYISLVGSTDDVHLPPDIYALSGYLRDAQTGIGPRLTEFEELLPDDLVITRLGWMYDPPTEENYRSLVDEFGKLPAVEVQRTPVPTGNTVAVIALNSLDAGRRYNVTADVSLATAEDLKEAGTDYPHWVTDHYLQVPPTLPERVRQLSESVTGKAESVHDKVLAIKQYFYRLPYRLETEPLPLSVDGVDYFLFVNEGGNCIHFASAMAVMLRCSGVPSRVCLGYHSTEWDPRKGECIVRDKHYHAWPQVYFPDYGWINFEATPTLIGEYAELWYGEGTPVDGLLEQPFGEAFRNQAERQGNFWAVIIGSTIALAALALLAAVFWFGKLSARDYASSAYRKLCFLASIIRVGPVPQQTPREYGDLLAQRFSEQSTAVGNIIEAYQRQCFSPLKGLSPEQGRELKRSWRMVYHRMMKRLFLFR